MPLAETVHDTQPRTGRDITTRELWNGPTCDVGPCSGKTKQAN